MRAGHWPSVNFVASHTRREAGSTLFGGGSLVETSDLIGASWLPTDGQASPSDITQSLAKGARMHGAKIHEGVTVTGFVPPLILSCTSGSVSRAMTLCVAPTPEVLLQVSSGLLPAMRGIDVASLEPERRLAGRGW